MRRLRPALIAECGAPGELDDLAAAQAGCRALGPAWVDAEGMATYLLVLDPEGRAVLEAALGPLSAPRPDQHGPDPRPTERRRADALVEIARRGAAFTDQVAGRKTATKTQLVLTMTLTDLIAGLGAGTTLATQTDGTLLAPQTVRRLACEAGITPAVLGTRGQVLDLGLTARLFTPDQVKALWLRDRACAYPGCDGPAAWCDAHHLLHWPPAVPPTDQRRRATNGAVGGPRQQPLRDDRLGATQHRRSPEGPMGLLTFNINVTVDGCVDHREGIADDETHAYFTGLLEDSGALLFGRVTYELMEDYWPAVARGEVQAPPALQAWADALETHPKYIASSKRTDYPWTNSHHLAGDLREQVQELKDSTPDGVLVGSGSLATALDRLDLIDDYRLLIHPVIAGHGPTLHGAGLPATRRLDLVSSSPMSNGVMSMHYRRAR
ncbi:MAG: DUF222 domain-containing protein [Micrococcales bacterium]|nr:DUF222 domain-containing protein [Micrococcales bacterium]